MHYYSRIPNTSGVGSGADQALCAGTLGEHVNALLEALARVWQDLSEETKQAITIAISHEHRWLFEDWIEDIRHGFSPDHFAKRASIIAQTRLDRELFRKGDGKFARTLLTTHFTTTQREINRAWLEYFSAAAQTEGGKASKDLAEASLCALRGRGFHEEIVALYEATLRYACPEWFVDGPPDLGAIDVCLSKSVAITAMRGVSKETSLPVDVVRAEHGGAPPQTGEDDKQLAQPQTSVSPAGGLSPPVRESTPIEVPRLRDEGAESPFDLPQGPVTTVQCGPGGQSDDLLAVSRSIAEKISSMQVAAAREALASVQAVFDPIEDSLRETAELVRRIGKGLNELKTCRLLPPAVLSSVDLDAALRQPPSDAKADLQTVDALIARVAQAFGRWEALVRHAPATISSPSLGECTDLVSLAETMGHACGRMEVIVREYAERLRRFSDFIDHITTCEFHAAKRVLLDADPSIYTDALWLVLYHTSTNGNGQPNEAETDHDAAAMLEAMKSDDELRSLVVALSWEADAATTISLLRDAGHLMRDDVSEGDVTLQFMSLPDLFHVCQEVSELMPSALSLTASACLNAARQDSIHWLQKVLQLPNVDPVCRDFCMQLASHLSALGIPKTLAVLGRALFPGSAAQETHDDVRRRVLGAINTPAGQHHTYHRLREVAREVYLSPLLPMVQRGNATEALASWQAGGDCVMKAERCASKLSGPRRIDNQHLLNTKRYLEEFEETLLAWSGKVSASGENPLAFALQQKAAAIAQSRRHSPCAQRLFRMLQIHCAERKVDSVLDAEGVIRTDSGGVGGACLKPWRMESWIEASNSADGAASMQALLFDLVNEKAGPSPDRSEAVLIQTLFDREEIRAASRLAHYSDEAREAFDRLSSERYNRTVSEYVGVMADAKDIQYRDETVRLWMEETDQLLATHAYAQAAEVLKELAAAVKEFHEKKEGRYGSLLVWLREAGQSPSENATIQELESKAATLRAQAVPRRRHLEALARAGERERLPDQLRGLCAALGQTLDTPARWPTIEQSQDLAQALGEILGYVERRWASPARISPLTVGLVSGLHAFLKYRLQGLSSDGGSPTQDCVSQITDLALGIGAGGWETTDVLDHIGTTIESAVPMSATEPVSSPELAAPTPELTTAVAGVAPISLHSAASGLTMARAIADYRDRLAALTNGVERSPTADDKLRSNCIDKDWNAALSASLAMADQGEKSEHALSSYEIIAAAALYHRSKGVDTRVAERDVCTVAVTGISYALLLNERSESYYFLPKEHLELILVNAVACAVLNRDERADEGRALRTNLAAKLAAMWEGKATEPSYLWLQQILSSTRLISVPNRFRSCASVIADVLWGTFTGLDVDVAQPRAKLLLLGYRMRLIDEVVGHLAREHAKPLDHHVVQFLRAVQVAEANPTAWDEARRLAQSFLEQVPPRGMKPWRLFIDTLNRAVKRDASELACAVSLENYVFDPDGKLMLELRLSPSAYNFPVSLTLSVQSAVGSAKGETTSCDVTEGDVLACERVIRVGVPVDGEGRDDVVLLGYRLTGATTQNDPIDIRGEWRAERAKGRYQPLPAPVVARAWKGRDGKPVDRSMNVFHGREKEQRDIDNVLNGQGGVQGSAMIIGQRRIGKTSLLMEAQGRYPPQDGHVCGVFVDFSGISKKAREEPLPRAFFRALTTLEDAGGRNRGLNAEFKAKLGHDWNDRLRHGLDPVTSLPSALTRFVDRMSEHTNGKVRRVAFFVDEFQSVFKFDRKEVDEVMWALRPIVQMSPSISLILAGSGLTRELVRGYDQAFFGSITTIGLRPFVLPADIDAVRDTLLPEEVRDHLCPPGRDLDGLVRYAFELCQGHPWFLSMLGYSAAQVLEGRPLSPALLNHVAREMIHGHVDFQDQETGAARFYGHIFDTLDSIGRRGDIAKLVLDNVARQVTLDWPWLTAEQAIHGPTLQDAQVSERESLDALRLLRDEDVLDHRKGPQNIPQYRIRVPLVAEALKFDAADIVFDAVQDLKQPTTPA